MRVLFSVFLTVWALPLMAETLVPAKFEEQSPREDLRKRIFSDNLTARACRVVSKNPSGAVEADSGLTLVIQDIVKAITAKDDKALAPLFHPQIKIKSQQVKAALTAIERISGPKMDATLFRAYAMNNLTGDTESVLCDEDGLVLFPLYGHPLQVGVWIQVQGRDEVTRVYVILVPGKQNWRIGAWHVQQWTHAGKDFITWRQEAQALVEKKEPMAAWFYFDLTAKLMDGGKFIKFPVAQDIEAERDKLYSSQGIKDVLAAKFSGEKLVYISSLFSRNGVALLLRFGIPEEWSANAIKTHCQTKFKDLMAESWMKMMAGIRCDYVLPKESPLKEGAHGGIFVDKDSVKGR